MTRDELDAALLAAHDRGDGTTISALYAEAAVREQDASARAFLLTQAYIFALEAGSQEAQALRRDLIALGAER